MSLFIVVAPFDIDDDDDEEVDDDDGMFNPLHIYFSHDNDICYMTY